MSVSNLPPILCSWIAISVSASMESFSALGDCVRMKRMKRTTMRMMRTILLKRGTVGDVPP